VQLTCITTEPTPTFSFAAVGRNSDELVRHYSLTDPLAPLKALLKEESHVLTIGVGLDSVPAIQIAEQRHIPKFVKECALTVGPTGPVWVDVVALGCSAGFQKLANHINSKEIQQTELGSATAFLYPMKELCVTAELLLKESPVALSCERPEFLGCHSIPRQ
jgi:aminoglycoside N3'-acetyltransferase